MVLVPPLAFNGSFHAVSKARQINKDCFAALKALPPKIEFFIKL